jgi:hypothetical protein
MESLSAVPVPNPESKRPKGVYTIVRRPGLQKPLWLRIGAAFVNHDQSLNLKLDALPVNGELHIRDQAPNDWPRRTQTNDPFPSIGGEP